MTIRIATPDFCVASSSIEALKRCKTFKARLVGPGIDSVRKFALIELDDEPLIADCITGTVYRHDGLHHTIQGCLSRTFRWLRREIYQSGCLLIQPRGVSNERLLA